MENHHLQLSQKEYFPDAIKLIFTSPQNKYVREKRSVTWLLIRNGEEKAAMVEVEEVHIDVRMPSDQIRFVAMQPFAEVQAPAPFKWPVDKVEEQLDAIRRTLDIARECSASFTLFPEYSIPGVDGADIIDRAIESDGWPVCSVVIAGLHGLTKDEYTNLCRHFNVTVSPANIENTVWRKTLNVEFVR